MCGRFAFYSPREAIAEMFDVESTLDFAPRYNISPGTYITALRANEDGEAAPAMLRWGLIPSWAKDPKIGQRLTNARAETVHEKPSFRSAFRRRRCVILADGFYEWRKTADGKQPYFIVTDEGAPFAMAGLWERWASDDGPLDTCTIITTAATAQMQALHGRMPVILEPDAARRWIDTQSTSTTDLADQLSAGANVRLQYWPVSKAVNNSRNEGPELIQA